MKLHDMFANFGYFNAFDADVTSSSEGDTNGNTVDMKGYNAIGFVFNAQSLASGGGMAAADKVLLILEHGLPSDDGVSAWSTVPNSQIIHSVYGGIESTGTTGIFASLQSATDVTDVSGIFKVGYRQDPDHRYVRVVVRNSDAASAMWLAGVAVLGEPNQWPVNDPISS